MFVAVYPMSRLYPTLLAIESSCDETAAAVSCAGKIISNVVATQAVHAQYGGVVPELASRAHQQHIVPVVQQALQQAGIVPKALDAVAFTQGPGLLGALLVGTSFAKAMAWALQVPLIAVHHMKAHVLAHCIDPPVPTFPFLCLTVSGGHTQLVLVKDYLAMEVLGTTQDDAIGEAFDKIGKRMGFAYPAGPHIDRHAQQGDPRRFVFPTTTMPQLDFSFSGIKTAFVQLLQQQEARDPEFLARHRDDLCASVQRALIQMLLDKLHKAVAQTGITTMAVAGGVAANTGLRKALQEAGDQAGWQVFVPSLAYCTDNAAMVAMAAHYQYVAGDFCDWQATALPRMPY